jgi:hypothetical protein
MAAAERVEITKPGERVPQSPGGEPATRRHKNTLSSSPVRHRRQLPFPKVVQVTESAVRQAAICLHRQGGRTMRAYLKAVALIIALLGTWAVLLPLAA